MCGRYQFTAEQSAEIQQIIQGVQERVGRKIKTGEICPTDQAPVLRNTADGINPDILTWGVPVKGKPVINARVESVIEKPLFRGSVEQRRCVIPSSGFYEWDPRKQKYLFRLFGEDSLYMAGIYQEQQGTECYCVLTTAANNSMLPVHNRMPLVLKRNQIVPWLRDNTEARNILRGVPPELDKTEAESGKQMKLW